MATPPRFQPQNEREPTCWLKRRRGVVPPWKFCANLQISNVASMRRLAEYIHHSLSFRQAAAFVSGRMNWVERYEGGRMVEETNRYNPRKRRNRLLFDVLTWFGNSYKSTNEDVLARASKLNRFVTVYVRRPEVYTVEHRTAIDQWVRFVQRYKVPEDKPEEPGEPESEEPQESGNTSSAYIDEEEDPIEVDEAQSSEAEDQDPEENTVQNRGQPSTAAYPSESFASSKYVEADDQIDLMFDAAFVSRLKFLDTGMEDNNAEARENCTLSDVTNHRRRGNTRTRRENFSDNGTGDKFLFEKSARNESIHEDNSNNDVVQEDTRNNVLRSGRDRPEEITTTVQHEYNDYIIVDSPRTDPSSEAETIIADPRGREKRKSTVDSSEVDNSDGSSSSDAPSINVFLDTILPKEGRTTRSGRGYNPYTGDMGGNVSPFGTPPLRSTSNPLSLQSPVRRGNGGRGGRPRGRGRGRGGAARSASGFQE